jgi:hypothetical protein
MSLSTKDVISAIFHPLDIDLPPILASQLKPMNSIILFILLFKYGSVIATELHCTLLSKVSNKETCYFLVDHALLF